MYQLVGGGLVRESPKQQASVSTKKRTKTKNTNYLLELFCKLNGACDGLSKGFGLEHDNGDEGLLFPKFV